MSRTQFYKSLMVSRAWHYDRHCINSNYYLSSCV